MNSLRELKPSRILTGDAFDMLRTLPDESIHCCVTSPPYYGLRDYGVEGQLGLEPTLQEYLTKMSAVFEEVWRVLRKDGTCWVNMGDSYANDGKWGGHSGGKHAKALHGSPIGRNKRYTGFKPKDLMGVPWRLAFALQDAGWYLRSEIIWHKPNPMPESVQDRPTRAHETIFLFAKGQGKASVVKFSDLRHEYIHFVSDGIPSNPRAWAAKLCVLHATSIFQSAQLENKFCLPSLDSKVWIDRIEDCNRLLVPSVPSVHRAAIASGFLNGRISAEEFLNQLNSLRLALGKLDNLLECRGLPFNTGSPCIDGNAYATIRINDSGNIGEIDFTHHRIVYHMHTTCKYWYDADAISETSLSGDKRKPYCPGQVDARGNGHDRNGGMIRSSAEAGLSRNARTVWTIATCAYPDAHFATFPPEIPKRCILAGCPIGGTVLDPFAGSGTTLAVAHELGREFIGIELNPEYVKLIEKRLTTITPSLFKEPISREA